MQPTPHRCFLFLYYSVALSEDALPLGILCNSSSFLEVASAVEPQAFLAQPPLCEVPNVLARAHSLLPLPSLVLALLSIKRGLFLLVGDESVAIRNEARIEVLVLDIRSALEVE